MTKVKYAWFFGLVAFGLGVGSLGWFTAQRNCHQKVVGEKNAASLIIAKALTQFREGQVSEALVTLETTLDMAVSYAWEQNPHSAETTNILSIIKRYRSQYPAFSQSLRSNGSPVLLERNLKANSILSNAGQN